MANLTKLDLSYIVHGNSKRIEFKESYTFFNHSYIRDVYLDNVLIRNFVYCTLCKKFIKQSQRGRFNIEQHCLKHRDAKSPSNVNNNCNLNSSPTVKILAHNNLLDEEILKVANNESNTIMKNNDTNKISRRWVIRDILNIEFDENGNKVATVFFKGEPRARIIPIDDIPKYNPNHIKCDNDFTIPSDNEDIEKIECNKRKRGHHSNDQYKHCKHLKSHHHHNKG